ncbi:hypothetical protein EUTSA_v10024013mg [Eutrema salsugineum]|uniref:RRM domain-containing protein n=1 Tax=Eutrema salsugineum TaxID=72664 RepID=V4MCF7_EUTSA|nr:hypothetical protein EUTSA_v10024013mg [Eutrema salsugineum]
MLKIFITCKSKSDCSSIRRLVVEGYDTGHDYYDLDTDLRECFSSCRFAFIYLRGEGAEEKALELSGNDVGGRGGRKLVVKAYPFEETYLDLELSIIRGREKALKLSGRDVGGWNIEVTGVSAPLRIPELVPYTSFSTYPHGT